MAKASICSLDSRQGMKEGNHLDSASSTWIRASHVIKNMQMIFIMVMFQLGSLVTKIKLGARRRQRRILYCADYYQILKAWIIKKYRNKQCIEN